MLEWAEVPAPATMKEVWTPTITITRILTRRLHAIPAGPVGAPRAVHVWGRRGDEGPRLRQRVGIPARQIHHRGQLSTYLRPMGSKVPQIYGPSADEPM